MEDFHGKFGFHIVKVILLFTCQFHVYLEDRAPCMGVIDLPELFSVN